MEILYCTNGVGSNPVYGRTNMQYIYQLKHLTLTLLFWIVRCTYILFYTARYIYGIQWGVDVMSGFHLLKSI